MREIDGRAVCVCDDDLARTGSGRVTGTGRWASGGGVAEARNHAGRRFYRVSGAGDVVASRGAVEGACRGGGRTGVCPMVDGVGVGPGLCPRAREEGPSC